MRRHENGGYYHEDYAPYDREHWPLFLDAIAWLTPHVGSEFAEGTVIAWVSSGRLPYATLTFDWQRGEAPIMPWGGPPPSGLVLYEQIQEARQRGGNPHISAQKAVPYGQEGEPVTVGYAIPLVHRGTLLELARSQLSLDLDTTADTTTGGGARRGYLTIRAELRRLHPRKSKDKILTGETARLGRHATHMDIAKAIDEKIWAKAGNPKDRAKMVGRALKDLR